MEFPSLSDIKKSLLLFFSIDIFKIEKAIKRNVQSPYWSGNTTMIEFSPLFCFIQIFVFLLGVSIGHSLIMLKIHREENRKKELELALLEKRSDLLSHSKQIAEDLEEVLYNAKVQQEIDDILRKSWTCCIVAAFSASVLYPNHQCRNNDEFSPGYNNQAVQADTSTGDRYGSGKKRPVILIVRKNGKNRKKVLTANKEFIII